MKVSCMCLTEYRLQDLKNAINQFLRQTLEDSELIIIYREYDWMTEEYLSSLRMPRVKPIKVDSGQYTLGELRNMAKQVSVGKYITHWDDDDWHHPKRLQIQYETLETSIAKVCGFERVLLHDKIRGEMRMSGLTDIWENTMMYKADFPYHYPKQDRHEDTVLLELLRRERAISINDDTCAYVYNFHGNNISGQDHWDRLWHRGEEVFDAQLVKGTKSFFLDLPLVDVI